MFNITPIRPDYSAPAASSDQKIATDLRAASQKFIAAHQTGKAQTCLDMAHRIAKFGASEKQVAFAAVLVKQAAALQPAPKAAEPPVHRVADLFAVMQKHSHFYVGELTLARKNQDSLVWIKHEACDKVVGKIEQGKVSLFMGRLNGAGIDWQALVALLDELNANPLGAAMKYGKLAGRCCSCGRDLTDPESISLGIGPVCITKFSGV